MNMTRGNLLKLTHAKWRNYRYKYTFDKVGNIIRRDEYRNTMYVGSTVMELFTGDL
jgi:YD repeat-containing protein